MAYQRYFMSYLSYKDLFVLLNVTLTVAAALLLYRTNSIINHWSVELKKQRNTCVEELHKKSVTLFRRQNKSCPSNTKTLGVRRLKKNVMKGQLPQRNVLSSKKGRTHRVACQSKNDLLQIETGLNQTSSSGIETMAVLQDTRSDDERLHEVPNTTLTENQRISRESFIDSIKYDCLPSDEPVNTVENQYTTPHEQEQSCQNFPTDVDKCYNRALNSRQNSNREDDDTFVKRTENISMSLSKIHSSTLACANAGLCDISSENVDLCAGENNDKEDENGQHMHIQGETTDKHITFQSNSGHSQYDQKDEQIKQQKVPLNEVRSGSILSASSEETDSSDNCFKASDKANRKYQEQRCDQKADYGEYIAVVNVQKGETNVPFKNECNCKTKYNCCNENVQYSEQNSNTPHTSEYDHLKDPVNDSKGLPQPLIPRESWDETDGDNCKSHSFKETTAKYRISAEKNRTVPCGKSEDKMNNSIEEDGDLSNYGSSSSSTNFELRQITYDHDHTDPMAQRASDDPCCNSEDEITIPKFIEFAPVLTGGCSASYLTLEYQQHSHDHQRQILVVRNTNSSAVITYTKATDISVDSSEPMLFEKGKVKSGDQRCAIPDTIITSEPDLVESVFEKHSHKMHDNIYDSDSLSSAENETSPKTHGGTLSEVKGRSQWEGCSSELRDCVTSESHLNKEEVEETFGVNLRIDNQYPLTFQDIQIEKIPSVNSDKKPYNWTNLTSDEYENLGDVVDGFAFWMSSNRPIYEQLKQIRWVMGYFSSGNSIDVFVDLDGMDPGFYLEELCRITEQPPSKFHIKDNNHQWSL